MVSSVIGRAMTLCCPLRKSKLFVTSRLFRFSPIDVGLCATPARRSYVSVTNAMDQLNVQNSLRPGFMEPFKPMEPGKISWYACGPTVYDRSHLGHARNYVSTDIIRRILMHYFGFKVNFVMNMTDVDDKIIVRARREHLLEQHKKQYFTSEDRRAFGLVAFKTYAAKFLPQLCAGVGNLNLDTYDHRKKRSYNRVLMGKALKGNGKPGDEEARIRMHLQIMDDAFEALTTPQYYPGIEEILRVHLDRPKSHTYSDDEYRKMCSHLTKNMEALFLQDMDRLNVLRPDHITRVTEYMDQIVKFVQRIVDKGFAYEAQGSVYFDTTAFQAAGNTYARLRPDSKNDSSLQAEGEGSLSKNLDGKKAPGHFALWKSSKPGEPSWPSPWGPGRPGWHIECSVMASDILGSAMDIHSGGIDLAFPHHDNELAQSEAYFCQEGKGEHTWVNYFLHMGHLTILGSKMSKSLKNFQTVHDALESRTYTPRGLRILFLLSKWNDGVEISPEMKVQADSWESTISTFLRTVKSKLADQDLADGVKSLSVGQDGDIPADDGLLSELENAKKSTEIALCNSFDTPQVMALILRLVSAANASMVDNYNLAELEAVARWITKMVCIFGLDANAKLPYDGLGWDSTIAEDADPATVVQPFADVLESIQAETRRLRLYDGELSALVSHDVSQEARSVISSGTRDLERLALPYVRAMSRIRDRIRQMAKPMQKDSKARLLLYADRIRDHYLANLGVQIMDEAQGPSLILFASPVELIAAREEKEARLEQRKIQAREQKFQQAKQDRESVQGRPPPNVRPQDMFRVGSTFSEFDAKGIPTFRADGKQVSKHEYKRFLKLWSRQEAVHRQYLEELESSQD